jgi:hypothetical protein
MLETIMRIHWSLVMLACFGSQFCVAAPDAVTDSCSGGARIIVSHVSRERTASASEELGEWLRSIEDAQLRKRAEDAFNGHICKDDKSLMSELERIASGADPPLRAEAVKILSFLGSEKAMRIVRRSIRDKSRVVRLAALTGVDYVCDPEAIDAVQELISTEQSDEVLDYAQLVIRRLQGKEPCISVPKGLLSGDD